MLEILLSNRNVIYAVSSPLQLLANLGLNPAQLQLISGFIDTYLKLNTQETALFTEQLEKIEPRKQEEVMQIVTSWMEEGIEKGKKRRPSRNTIRF